METERGKFPPPPGLITSLAAGFDSVANSIGVITLPILLDLFLWLGPHLRLQKLLQSWWNLTTSSPYFGMPSGTDLTAAEVAWSKFIGQFNLFILLRTFPVGTPSLFSWPTNSPLSVPLGSVATHDGGSFLSAMGWVLLLVACGWILGSLYFYWVSSIAIHPERRSLGRSILHSLLLSIFWVAMLVILGIPVMLILSIAALINAALGQIVLVLLLILLMWLAVPVFFSAHGIFIFQLDAVRTVIASMRMARFTLPTTSLFLLITVIIGAGLDLLWRTPSSASWWMLVGIVGHAFVSTGLLAASFVYYRDVNVWLKAVFEQLQKRTQPVKG
jgi:hypothetical protein